MIPVLYSDGPLWLVGIAWNADTVAAFLAWWMPLNLISWLALTLILNCHGSALTDRGRSLGWILLMTLAFWPLLIGTAVYSLFTAKLETLSSRRACL